MPAKRQLLCGLVITNCSTKTEKICDRVISAKDPYECLVKCELKYGSALQSFQQISCNENDEATADLNAFR